MTPAGARLALAWLRREDWDRWCQLDQAFEPEYTRWLAKMNGIVDRLQRQGLQVARIDVGVEEFTDWNGTEPVTSTRRARFAALKMSQAMAH